MAVCQSLAWITSGYQSKYWRASKMALVDKWVTIGDGAQLKGLENNPVVIRKGVTV